METTTPETFDAYKARLIADATAKKACESAVTEAQEATSFGKLNAIIIQYFGWVGTYLPQYITPELCMAAVKQDGMALRFVPAELVTPELCMAAVKQDAYALQYVPEQIKNSRKIQQFLRKHNSNTEIEPEPIVAKPPAPDIEHEQFTESRAIYKVAELN